MLNWWCGLTGWAKYGLPLALLMVSTVGWFAGYFWPWGWAVGFVLLIVGMLFKDEKSGWEGDDVDD